MPVFFSPTHIQDLLDFASVPGAGNDGYALTWDNASGTFVLAEMAGGGGVTDHGALTGLADDDHAGYALLAGRAAGQTLTGGTTAGATLTLTSTSHATKGKILFGTSTNDEANDRLGVGTTNPGTKFHVQANGDIASSTNNAQIRISGATVGKQLVIGYDTTNNRGVIQAQWAGVEYSPLLLNPIDGNVGIGTALPGAKLEIETGAAATKGLIVQGFTSQTATLVQLQGISSTATVRERANIDAIAIDNTDATRKYAIVLSPWDTAAREGLRIESDGTNALSALGGAVLSGTRLAVHGTASGITAVFRANATTPGDIAQFQNSAGTTGARVDASMNFSRPGSGADSEQFGSGASATASNGVALGKNSQATNTNALACGTGAIASGATSVALGVGALANSSSSTAVGDSAQATAANTFALGQGARASGVYGIAIGVSAFSSHQGSVALGVLATTTAVNQLMIGNTVIPITQIVVGGASPRFVLDAATRTFIIQGAASQTAPLVQLQGLSSTAAVRERANIDAIAVDNTDATRKYAIVLSPWDTAAREAMRLWADGSAGRVAITAPASAPTDAHLANGQWSSYLDESGHNLVIRVKYSDGTFKTATIALT